MRKDGFYVQMHMHTSDTSACGRDTGADMARACKEAGYDMIVITDHFINANIGVDRGAPWAEKVEYLFRGYYSAKAEGDRIGLKVLKGWETFTKGPEYITLGLGEEFLLANPDIAAVPKDEYLKRVHDAGAFVIHAHPYRKAPYIPDFTPDVRNVDAFEVFNAAHRDPSFNEKALATARKFGLPMTAGSDAHSVDRVAGGAMRFDRELKDLDDLIAATKNGEGEVVEWLEP